MAPFNRTPGPPPLPDGRSRHDIPLYSESFPHAPETETSSSRFRLTPMSDRII